mmetsp:Transcript_64823/g.163268  ORF Transcript_64823/g.163268 Transcript_64823/m.163268 type:complete len:742 (+) Transcript_64823:83-2308(+)
MLFAPTIPQTEADTNLEEYQAFKDLRFSVTNYVESGCALLFCPCMGWQSKTLLLGDQEVTLKKQNLCGTSVQRRPYAQLGSVDKHQSGMCCMTIGSDLAPVNEKGEGGISPEWGCGNEVIVNEIVKHLQERKEKRGSVAQIRKLELMHEKVVKLATQVPLLLDKLGIKYQPQVSPVPEGRKRFPRKTIDVTNWCEVAASMTFKELVLEEEEALLTINGCCGLQSVTTKREYAQLGHVEKKKACFCCSQATSDLGVLSPGLGCDVGKVTDIVGELRERMGERGDVGQIRKQEKLLRQFVELSKEMEMLNTQYKENYPPDQATMVRLFGGDLKLPEKTAVQMAEDEMAQVDSKTYDITDKCEALTTMLCTCGLAGWTTSTLELTSNEVNIYIKNNFDDSHTKMAYAQLGSVDYDKSCCCCYSVNMAKPGWGCDRAKVEELAEELQARKVKRGNIAQIRQLEVMEKAAVELDVRTGLYMDEQGLQYPPEQKTMDRLCPNAPARVIKAQQTQPHMQPAVRFEQKSYDITDYTALTCGLLFCPCAGPTFTKMVLEPEEMYITNTNFCMKSNSRTPYAQLGSVEKETACCCCIQLPEVATPGCGCSHDLVTQIEEELQERKVKRGNIAQLKMQENLLDEILRLSVKLDMCMEKHAVAYPPDQETMKRVFGEELPPAPTSVVAPTGGQLQAQQMAVQVPEGATPGTSLQVQAPGGQLVQVQVPDGVAPGQTMMVQVPSAPLPQVYGAQ